MIVTNLKGIDNITTILMFIAFLIIFGFSLAYIDDLNIKIIIAFIVMSTIMILNKMTYYN